MKKTTVVTSFCALVAATGMSVNVMAQAPTCSDIVWSAAVLEATPSMPEHCLEVVERNGAWYAKTTAKVVRQGVNSTVVRYQNADGTWGSSERAYPPRGFTAQIAGEEVRIADLAPNQEVNVYVHDQGNFTIPMLAEAAPAPAAAAAPAYVEEEEEDTYMEPAPAALPSTAGQANWLAVLGTLLVLMAAAVHVVRTRN